MELIATCAFGLEKLVFQELKKLGLWIIKTEDGRVTFEGTPKDIIRSNLWLRTAGRVHIKMYEGKITNFDQLFEEVSSLPWEKYIGVEDQFPVVASSAKSILYSESALQSIVKKAVATKLTQVYKKEHFAESSEALYQIRVHFNKDNCLISIDTSGESLHKRGYRSQANLAPMKETLASALVMLSDWTPEKVLVDPFCGSGTILLEAAHIACNMAPGLERNFPFLTWSWISSEDIQSSYKEAREAKVTPPELKIYGFDNDATTIAIALENAKRAGFTNVRFEVGDMRELDFHAFSDATFITNPPYGERLEEADAVRSLYRTLGEKFATLPHASLFIINPFEGFEHLFGRKPDKNRKLFNGKIRCYLFSYFRKVT